MADASDVPPSLDEIASLIENLESRILAWHKRVAVGLTQSNEPVEFLAFIWNLPDQIKKLYDAYNHLILFSHHIAESELSRAELHGEPGCNPEFMSIVKKLPLPHWRTKDPIFPTAINKLVDHLFRAKPT